MKKNSEYTHLWRPNNIEGLDLFDAFIFERKFPKHMHDNYTICVTEQGIGEIYCQGKVLKADTKHILLINPEEVHAGWALKGHSWKYRVMYIDKKLMHKVADEGSLFNRELLKHPELITNFQRVFSNFLTSNPKEVCEGDTLHFLENLIAVAVQEPKAVKIPAKIQLKERLTIKKVKDYLREHYGENVSISELASMVGLSANYLIRTFRKTVGLPPHAYQMQVRIQEAKKALLGCKPIAQVALEAGFFDQSHLNRCFKRILGVTPQQYRQ